MNGVTDQNGHRYARKAILRTGLPLSVTGMWEGKQVSEELQVIIAKRRAHLLGAPVLAWKVKTDSEISDELN